MKRPLTYTFAILLLLSPFFSGHSTPVTRGVLSEYQRDVISYFKEIALGFEYGNASKITRKWAAPINIYVTGTPTPELLQELTVIRDEINELMTDNVRLNLVSSRDSANFVVFLGTSEEYGKLYPKDELLAKKNSGIYRIYWNPKNEITKGHLFVSSKTTITEQRHVLREELTQSLGLGRDSDWYTESIFQSRYTTPTQYAPIDRDLIRLLYHPSVKPGLASQDVDFLLTQILLAENETESYTFK